MSKKLLAALACGWICLGCGGAPEDESQPAVAGQIDAYLTHIKPLLQEVRALDVEIARAVPTDSIASDVIVPLIEQRFRPKLIELMDGVQKISATPELATLHNHLRDYLRLRLEAFDLAVEGERQGQPELFDEFAARLEEADEAGRALKIALDEVRYNLGGL